MDWKKREHSFDEHQDKTGENRLFARFVLTEEHSGPEAFAMVFLATINNQDREIVRFDGNKKEPANVHRFYLRKEKKQFLEKPINWETLEECAREIRKNWRIYRAQFIETKGL